MQNPTITGLLHGRGTRVAIMAFIAALLAVVAVPAVTSTPASAHGWVTSPSSRQDHCAAGTTSFDCGAIQYEPQSVEAPKGSMLCSGGSDYTVLDDDSLPWPRTQTDTTVTFRWNLTAAHATSTWEYFVDGELFATYDQGGQQPPSNIQHTLTGLPEGDHTILARWNIADTPMAFYNCVDLTIGDGGSSPTPTPTSTGTPTPTATPTPTPTVTGTPVICGTPWDADTTYTGSEVVTYAGHEWRAKWWTQGEVPGEQWGPWEDLGPCDPSTSPTSAPGPTSTPSPTPTATATSTPSPTPTATSTPSPTPTAPTCTSPGYEDGRVYVGGDLVIYQGQEWKARWWNQQAPADELWGPWELVATCADPV